VFSLRRVSISRRMPPTTAVVGCEGVAHGFLHDLGREAGEARAQHLAEDDPRRTQTLLLDTARERLVGCGVGASITAAHARMTAQQQMIPEGLLHLHDGDRRTSSLGASPFAGRGLHGGKRRARDRSQIQLRAAQLLAMVAQRRRHRDVAASTVCVTSCASAATWSR